MTRNEKMNEIEAKAYKGITLTEDEQAILTKRNSYSQELAMFQIHQLGDPQNLSDMYMELCRMIDEEIRKGESR